MRCSRGGRAAVLTLTVTTLLVARRGSSRRCGPGPTGRHGGEGQDRAVPALDVEAQLAAAGVSTTPGEAIADAARGRSGGRLPLRPTTHEGIRTGRLLRAAAAGHGAGVRRAAAALRRFGRDAVRLPRALERRRGARLQRHPRQPASQPEVLQHVLEQPRPGPSPRPDVHARLVATPWSTGSWLPTPAGNYSANARRLGVQQILWRDRCWNTDDDRGVVSRAEDAPSAGSVTSTTSTSTSRSAAPGVAPPTGVGRP